MLDSFALKTFLSWQIQDLDKLEMVLEFQNYYEAINELYQISNECVMVSTRYLEAELCYFFASGNSVYLILAVS